MTTPGNDPFTTPPPPGQGSPTTPPYGVPDGQTYGAPTGRPYGAPQHGAPAPQPYGTPGGPQYGAPAPQPYGAPGWQQPAPSVRKTRGAKILTFLGIGLGLVSLVLLVVGFSQITSAVAQGTTELTETIVTVPSPGTRDTELAAGSTYEIWATQSTTFSPSVTDITVTDPTGAVVALSGATNAPDLSDLGIDLVGRFTTTETGTYTVTVPEGADVVLTSAGAFDDLVSTLTAGGGMLVGGFLLGSLAFLMTVAGAIWWGVAASNNRKARALGAGRPVG
ncbi:hypothetical protein IGS67_12765 [Flavimobilis sp. GY10621]|uniref:Uncharacterized protein n=1 Tax=Flavimobilis rhizosphaerae TaxID=2775421 RepID=A0ABR9DVE2_9MICO|nr:hypothetical protein [Flavimobilis rhizosphaerae]MBD9700346.1 hypothetical protein [Flavimobilis rhizosphaerae]